MNIKTVIVEDQVLITAAYKALLMKNEDIEFVGEATNEKSAIELIRKTRPDVALMDIQLDEGSGLTVTKVIQRISPNTRILALSQHKDLSMVHRMMNAGASGFVTKMSDANELAKGIRAVAEGKLYFCSSLKDDYSNLILNPKHKAQYNDVNFTPREKEIIQHIADGKTPDEIADYLGRSKRTIEVYLGRIYKKLDIKKVIHLVMWAKDNPWVYI
jgi:DNA-binding NarL/FixJ family response regulator